MVSDIIAVVSSGRCGSLGLKKTDRRICVIQIGRNVYTPLAAAFSGRSGIVSSGLSSPLSEPRSSLSFVVASPSLLNFLPACFKINSLSSASSIMTRRDHAQQQQSISRRKQRKQEGRKEYLILLKRVDTQKAAFYTIRI